MLHRHWSLYEAMRHSPYIAPRMQTWREGGAQKLGMVLVNMGIRTEEAKHKFSEASGLYWLVLVD